LAQGIPDWVLAAGLLIGGYYAWKEGMLQPLITEGQKIIDEIFQQTGLERPGGGGGGGDGGDGGGGGDEGGG
jgi:hypothetical protein